MLYDISADIFTWIYEKWIHFQYPSMEKVFEVEAHKNDIDDVDISPAGDRVGTLFHCLSLTEHKKCWD